MIGDIISAGTNLIGGFLNRAENRRQNEANLQAQREMNAQNIQLQKDFAQQGIRWKVDDAKAAGIHPLYALGASTTSFSPLSISGGTADTSLGDSFSRAGQDIGRAINSTRTSEERAAAATQTALQLEGLKLDNDIKKATIASTVQRIRQSANPPMQAAKVAAGLVPNADSYEERPLLRGDTGPFDTNPRVVNAEDIEKRYGDVIQELWGAYTFGADALHHARKNTRVTDTGVPWYRNMLPRWKWRDNGPSRRPWGE